jgi:arylsulfatase A-like enzyme
MWRFPRVATYHAAFCWLFGHCLLAWMTPAALASDKPNILFIFADDHSPKTVSCYERCYGMAHTPNIDALAASGVRFRVGYMGSWCMPSRASLLTGLHPHAIQSMRMEGDYPGSVYDPEQCRFWPAEFRKQGYQTAQIGKWHTGIDAGWGRDWDFQAVWNRPDNPENAPAYYKDQIIDFNGRRETVEGYPTDNYTNWACDYIRGKGRQADKPWYLWVCYGAIHTPTTPAERHQDLLKGRTETPPANILGPRPGKPSYLDDRQAWAKDAEGNLVMTRSGQSFDSWLQQVHECMMSVDEGVGAMIKALEESGQLDNTLVVYTSDQGYCNGEHGLRQKVAPYDAAYGSPLIVSMPGTIPAGQYCRHSVNSPDLVVTFFSQAGLSLPWKMHGRDITPLLQKPESADWSRPTLFTNTGEDYGSNVAKALKADTVAKQAGVPYFAAICLDNIKYVRYLAGSEPEELYDLEADPEELTNIASDPDRAEQLELMQTLLMDELEAVDADFLSLP